MAEASAIWAEYEISPVEIAMPGNKVGLTLRAYRMASALTPTDVSEREDDDEVFNARDARRTARRRRAARVRVDQGAARRDRRRPGRGHSWPRRPSRRRTPTTKTREDDDEDADDEPADEEVPIFLSHKGNLLLFRSAEGLATFVKSKAPHDLTQLEGWTKFAGKVKPADVDADERTPTSWTWSWRTCVAGLTPGTRLCCSAPGSSLATLVTPCSCRRCSCRSRPDPRSTISTRPCDQPDFLRSASCEKSGQSRHQSVGEA